RIGMVHLLDSRFDEAILWLDKARIANPTLPGPHAWLAQAFALTGRVERAAAALAEAWGLSPDQRYTSIERFQMIQPLGSEKARSLFHATFLVGLRKAGVPER